jgi:Sec7-like guanine-nucleotide exchange factor
MSLRKLCRQIRLPGEAQQIDRILERFAALYHDQVG